MTTRRSFLTTSSLAAAALGTPWRLWAERWSSLGLVEPPPRRGVRVGDPDLKALAHRALEVATAAGASYAEVRFTVTRQRHLSGFTAKDFFGNQGVGAWHPSEAERVAVGVRALAQGAWGFVADTELTPEMMEWLGRKATSLGKISAWPKCPPIELGERPPVAVGTWVMPGRDPFTVSEEEHQDTLQTIMSAVTEQGAQCIMDINYERQVRTFASTDGAFTTQTVYNTFSQGSRGDSRMVIGGHKYDSGGKWQGNQEGGQIYYVPLVSPCGMGFEVFERLKFLDHVDEWVARVNDFDDIEPLEAPGKFEVVFDASAMAGIVNTIGAATEVDRVLGYEANSVTGGTSYLGPVEKVLGTTPFPAGVTITANRTLDGGAATVKWDSEGVAPQDFPIIQDGKLVDYATSREFVSELAGWYKAHGQTAQSRGCSGIESALTSPLVQTPNLRLHPGAKNMSFDELLVGIDNGIAFLGGDIAPDHQQLNAMGGEDATAYRIKKGKLAGMIDKSRYMVRIPDLWKDLVALGGERSAGMRGFTAEKGQPGQKTVHSVQAVAARFRNVSVIGLPGY